MRSKLIHSCALLILPLLISSCSYLPSYKKVESGQYTPWPTRSMMLGDIKEFTAKGKIKVETSSGTDSGTDSGSFNWHQLNNQYKVRFSGPLSLGRIQFEGDDKAINVTSRNGEQHYSQSPSELIQNLYGWNFPLSQIKYWAIGIPGHETLQSSALSPVIKLDQYGRIERFIKAGWLIHYKSYQTIEAMELPKKIILKHRNFGIKITMIIKSWDIQTNSNNEHH